MDDYRTLSHTTWKCLYHVVFIPKYRRKALYGQLCTHLGPVFRELARQKESSIEEGVVCPDHVHMLIWIPPKFSVSSVVGFIKGKSAIYVARHFLGKKRNYTGQAFWARGFFVSTVGVNEETIREYIQRQENEDKALDQLDFFPPTSSRKEPGNDDEPRTAQ